MAPNKWFCGDKESEIQFIVQKLTTTGRKTLDDGEMKKLKDICKSSDKYVSYAYYTLMTQLRKDHAEIRYSALLIVNELFCRSAVFRSKLQLDFEEFLGLVEGTDPEKPLPLPAPVAKELKVKGLEFIKNWAAKFGEKYIRLQLALTYLKKCRKVDFDDMEARSIAQRERVRQEQEHLDRVMNEKVSKVKHEMEELTEEISSVTIQMENCFRLLVPHPSDNLFSALDFAKSDAFHNDVINEHNDKINSSAFAAEDESYVLSASENKLRHHGLYDVKKTITIEVEKNSEVAVAVNDDTVPIIETLKDLEKQISTRYYPVVTRWLKVLSKGNNCSDILKKTIDLKLLLESSLEKYKELKIEPSKIKIDSDDDDDFEEVKEKEGYEENVKKVVKSAVRNPEQSCSKVCADFERTPQFKFKLREEDIKDPTTALSTLSKRFKNCQPVNSNVEAESGSINEKEQKKDPKKELLEKAPILPYDIDLYHWEEEKPLIPEVVKFDHLHKFWETKDDCDESEALIEVQRASLRTRKIDFSGKFEPVKWACRAPLPNGKLCPRRDRYKCPFHGKIIPRDSLGNPSSDPGCIPGPSTESTASAVPDWQDPQLLRDIEAATGIDLKIPDKKSKAGKKGNKKKEGLTNIKHIKDTVRERLKNKIVKRYHHYAQKLDDIEKKRFDDKFGDQWNYY